MESFSLLQRDVFDRSRWATRQQLRLVMITWSNGPTTDADAKPDSAD